MNKDQHLDKPDLTKGNIIWNTTDDGRVYMTTSIDDGHGNDIDFWLPTLTDCLKMLIEDISTKDKEIK